MANLEMPEWTGSALTVGAFDNFTSSVLADGSELVAVTRLSIDADDSIPLRLARTPKSVGRLSPKGAWEAVAFERKDPLLVEVGAPLVCGEPVVLRFVF